MVIGVHSPEFAFEKDTANVQKALHDLHVTYPVAVDSNLAIWQAFNNEYWPAHYFVDVQGRIRAIISVKAIMTIPSASSRSC